MTSRDVLNAGISCRIHPVVLFTVCDAFTRCAEPASGSGGAPARVIGTLLGSVKEDGTVEVRNCYAVPHQETLEQVALDIDFHRVMLDLHSKVHPNDQVVGWYSSGEGHYSSDALIQDFYGREAGEACIYLTVDTSLAGGKMDIRTYQAQPLVVGGVQLACQFTEVPLEAPMAEAERVGVELLRRAKTEEMPSDLAALEDTVQRLHGMVETVHDYVNGVVEGQISGDNEIGRHLSETVSAMPRLGEVQFGKLFENSTQDALLVMYLTKLTQAQLALADKLGGQVPVQQHGGRD